MLKITLINKVLAAGSKPTVTINDQGGATVDVVIMRIINYILPIVAAIAVGAILYSGALYILSQGDPDKVSKAKRSLLWSVVGLFVISISYVIVVVLSKVIKNEILI